MGLFIIAAGLLLLLALVISIPLFRHPLEPYLAPGLEEEDHEEVFSERDAILEMLSDLETSKGSGKLSEGDYLQEKTDLQRRYLELVEE